MSDWFRDGDLVIDYQACRVWIGTKEINLSALRFRILSYLTENAGQPVSPRQLLRHAWPDDQYDVGLVRWHISRLRQDLNDVPPTRIVHVRGFGYRYDRVAPQGIVARRRNARPRELRDRQRIRMTGFISCKPSTLKTIVTNASRASYNGNGSSLPKFDTAAD